MNIWNKILLGLIGVTSVAFFYFGVRTLGTHKHWRDIVNKLRADREQVAKEQEVLIHGAEGSPGIRQRSIDLNKYVVHRGRGVWYRAQPKGLNAGTGEVMVVTEEFLPKNALNMRLFVFRDPAVGQDGKAGTPGAYLGEFIVTRVNEAQKQWELRPGPWIAPAGLDKVGLPAEAQAALTNLTRSRLERLSKSAGMWTMYEVMPSEAPHLVAVPKDAAGPPTPSAKPPEGQPPAPQKPSQPGQQNVADYVSGLCDYEILFNEFYRLRAVMVDWINATVADARAVQAADNEARQETLAVEKDIAAASEELKEQKQQRLAAEEHRKALEAKLAEVQAAVQKTLEANRALAAEVARLQLEATRLIDEQTKRVAHAESAR